MKQLNTVTPQKKTRNTTLSQTILKNSLMTILMVALMNNSFQTLGLASPTAKSLAGDPPTPDQSTSIVGLVVSADSKPGETASMRVVTDPENYEGIPGLKVVKTGIKLPSSATASLEGVVVDVGDGSHQPASRPVVVKIPDHATRIPVNVLLQDEEKPRGILDVPLGEDGPIQPPIVKKPYDDYRGALRKAAEAGQKAKEAAEEAKKTPTPDAKKQAKEADDNFKKSQEAVKKAKKILTDPSKIREIEKEETERYDEQAQDADKAAKEKRDENQSEKQKAQEEANKANQAKEEGKTSEENEHWEKYGEHARKAKEAEEKAKEFEKEAERNRGRAQRIRDGLSGSDDPKRLENLSTTLPIAMSGSVQVLHGSFDGKADDQEVAIDGRPESAFLVAKSTHSIFYRLSETVPAGMHQVTAHEANTVIEFSVCVLKLTASAEKTILHKGDKTTFQVTLSGPETLPASAWEHAGVSSDLSDFSKLNQLVPQFHLPTSEESGKIVLVIANMSPETISIGSSKPILLELGKQDFKNKPFTFTGGISAHEDGGFKIDLQAVAFLAPIENKK